MRGNCSYSTSRYRLKDWTVLSTIYFSHAQQKLLLWQGNVPALRAEVPQNILSTPLGLQAQIHQRRLVPGAHQHRDMIEGG